jgi:hypothetical protein
VSSDTQMHIHVVTYITMILWIKLKLKMFICPIVWPITTGIGRFAECLKHSTYPEKHSAKRARRTVHRQRLCRMPDGTWQRKVAVTAPGNLMDASLSSANFWRSANLTAVSYRRLLTALGRAPPFAECLALGKDIFA